MNDHPAIKQIEISGLYGRRKLHASLQPGLNIIHGENGSGKTTFLHVLANLVDADIARFRHLTFQRIQVETTAGTRIEVEQRRSGPSSWLVVRVDGDEVATITPEDDTPKSLQHLIRDKLGGRPVYLPAFRAILEATAKGRYSQHTMEGSREEEFQRIVRSEMRADGDGSPSPRSHHFMRERAATIAGKTMYCRNWFGHFVPVIRYPAIQDVGSELQRELDEAIFSLAEDDRSTLNTVFIDVLRAVTASEQPLAPLVDSDKAIASMRQTLAQLDQVQPEYSMVYQTLESLLGETSSPTTGSGDIVGRVLKVYDTALTRRMDAQAAAFASIRRFERSVNRFFKDKALTVSYPAGLDRSLRYRRPFPTFIELADGRRTQFNVLSSGERQVLTLLFAATHMSTTDGIVLVDEPELSLHLDWKRLILSEVVEQAGDRQIIACTHAPEVASDHRDRLVRLAPIPWSSDGDEIIDNCDPIVDADSD